MKLVCGTGNLWPVSLKTAFFFILYYFETLCTQEFYNSLFIHLLFVIFLFKFLHLLTVHRLNPKYIIRYVCKTAKKRLLASSCLTVRPSVSPNGTIRLPTDRFSLNLVFGYFSKTVEKIQVSLKSDKYYRHFIWRPLEIFFIKSLSFLLRMRYISDKRFRGNQNTYACWIPVTLDLHPWPDEGITFNLIYNVFPHLDLVCLSCTIICVNLWITCVLLPGYVCMYK
jgi:hypothetical protein